MAAEGTFNVLYLGDVMGGPGRAVIAARVPALRKEYKIDFVIAQSENVSHGKSMTPAHMRELQAAGVDFFTGGNHSTERAALIPLLSDPCEPVTAPMNQPGVDPEWGIKIVHTARGDVLVMSLLGAIFPELHEPVGNPLRALDAALNAVAKQQFIAKIVNFHGDFSSEKRVIGFYADSRVSALIGDHWHVPTADAMVLPGGTAHITDVGMCGTLLTSLGVSKELIIERWRDGVKNKNDIAEGGPYQLNGVVVRVNPQTGLAESVTAVNEVLEKLG